MACGGAVTVLFQFIPGGDALWQRLAETVLARLEQARPGWLVLRRRAPPPLCWTSRVRRWWVPLQALISPSGPPY